MNARWFALLPLLEPIVQFGLKALAHKHSDAMTPEEAEEHAAEAVARYRLALARRP